MKALSEFTHSDVSFHSGRTNIMRHILAVFLMSLIIIINHYLLKNGHLFQWATLFLGIALCGFFLGPNPASAATITAASFQLIDTKNLLFPEFWLFEFLFCLLSLTFIVTINFGFRLRKFQQLNQDYAQAHALANIGMWRLNLTNRQMQWSAETYRIFGVAPAKSMTFESFLNCVHPDDRSLIDQEFQKAAGEGTCNVVHRIIANGNIKWVREKARLEFGKKGELLGWFGTTQDISETQAEERGLGERDGFPGHSQPVQEPDGSILWHGYLQDVTERQQIHSAMADRDRDRDRQLGLIMNAAPALLSYVTPDFRYVRVNQTYHEWFGLSNEQILGRTVQEVIGDEAWSIVGANLLRASQGEKVSFDQQIAYGKNPPLWVQATYTPDLDASQQVVGIVIHVIDIAERIQSKMQIANLNQQLQHRLEEMDKIFNTAPVGLAITYETEGANQITGNRTLEKMLGLPPGSKLSTRNSSEVQFTAMAIDKVLSPDEFPMQRAIRGEKITGQILNILDGKGQVKHLLANATPLLDENGKPRGAVGAFLNISQLVKAEESLKKGKQQLRHLIEQSPVSLAMFDRDMNYLVTSRLWLENYGEGRTSLTGLNHYEVLTDLPDTCRTAFEQGLAGACFSNDEDLWIRRDGRHSWKKWAIQPWFDELDQVGGIIVAAEDITGQHLAKDALKTSEQLVREILNSMPAMIAVLDKDGTITTLNEPWQKYLQCLGVSESQDNLSVGEDYLAVCRKAANVGHRNGKLAVDGLESLLRGETESFHLEYSCNPDDTEDNEQWFLMLAKRMNNSSRDLIVVHLDISEQKRAQAELEENKELLDLVMREVTAGYWEFNLKSGKYWHSPDFRRCMGIPEEEVITQDQMVQRIHDDDRERVVNNMRFFMYGNEHFHEIRYRLRHSNGTYRWVHSRIALFRDKDNRPLRLVGINLDITDYKKAKELRTRREDMNQSFRFYVAGQTAAAIAHELNQPLTAVISYADAAQMILEASGQSNTDLAGILKRCNEQAHRAGNVMRKLITLLHKGETSVEPIDLNETINHAYALLKTDWVDDNFSLDLNLADNLPKVLGSLEFLEKVLSILVMNGSEAMRTSGLENGAITIISRRFQTEPQLAEIIVRDTGRGVDDPEMLKKMFQPFYSTKNIGLGVGLAISRALVEAHQGNIWAQQEQGQGLSVHFTLPFA